MQEINKLTIGDSQYEIVDAAARASLADKADKAELETAGKVKTVNNLEPDEAGNITIEIPDPDLSEYYTKTDIDDKLGDLDAVLEVLGV